MTPGNRPTDRSPHRRSAPAKAEQSFATARAAGSSPPSWLAAVILVMAGIAFYYETFSYPFVFDDAAYISNKKELHSLKDCLLAIPHSHRPVVDFSFALNYALEGKLDYVLGKLNYVLYLLGVKFSFALGGRREWGYHLVNIAIHLGAALALFGIVRRTLSRGALASRYGAAAWGLGLGVALVWLVHPLQTESVTYVYQRFESLMGLWFLLTFYLYIRAQDSPRAAWWYAGTVATCLLAIGSKEVAAVLPLLLLWYDRAFLAASWRELLQRRWPFYATLAGVFAALAALALFVVHVGSIYRGGGMLEVPGISSWAYARTQPAVILHYLRLAFWPAGQCLDYNWPVAHTFGAIVLPALVPLGLLGLTVWCMWRHPAWGFVGGWFFLILAPSSSFIPIRDLAFEHRMYLSLAAVVVTVVVGGYELFQRWPAFRKATAFEQRVLLVGPLVLIAIALGTTTYLRNQTYCDRIALWEDVATKVPNNPRSHCNLGTWYQFADRIPEALDQFREAIRLDPNYYDAHYNLALLLSNSSQRAEDHAEAIRHFETSLESTAWFLPQAHNNLALLLEERGDSDGVQRHLEAAVKAAPKDPTIRSNYLRFLGKTDPAAAMRASEEWLRESPKDVEVLGRTALLLAQWGYRQRAMELCQQVLEIREESVEAHCLLGQLLAPDHPQEAIAHLQRVLQLEPRLVAAYLELGELFVRTRDVDKAISCFQSAVQLDPKNARARQRLRELLQSYSSPTAPATRKAS